MFEAYTYEYFLNRMLSNVSDDIDKREGSVVYNAIAPSALEIANLFKALDSVINLAFVDSSSGGYLDNLVKQFGFSRNTATFAIKKGVFKDANGRPLDINIGTRFSISGITYSALEKISDGVYQMKCTTAGEIGNTQYGNLLPIDYVENLSSAELTDILIPGEDEETDEELKQRFYESINSVAFGGNIADYKEKTKEIEGVGAVKVIPTWNGGGTVKLIILDSSYNTASTTLIENVKSAVGENGNGIAPIGHTVTVIPADEAEISVSSKVTLEEGAVIEVVKTSIEKAINEYLLELKKEWESNSSLTIRIAHIESRILNVGGVIDVSDTQINGSASNFVLTNEEIPLLSEVVLNE